MADTPTQTTTPSPETAPAQVLTTTAESDAPSARMLKADRVFRGLSKPQAEKAEPKSEEPAAEPTEPAQEAEAVETTETEAPPEPEAEAEAKTDEPEPEAEAKDEPKEEEPKKEEPWTVKRMRQVRRELARKEEQLAAIDRHLQARSVEIERSAKAWQDFERQLQRDPATAIDYLARRAGYRGQELWEEVTRRRLQEGPEADKGATESREARALREELAQIKAKLEEKDRSTAQQRHASEVVRQENLVHSAVAQKAQEWPHLASMPDEDRGALVHHAIALMHEHGIQHSVANLCKILEKDVADRYSRWSKARSSLVGQPKQVEPEQPKEPKAPPAKRISARDTSESSRQVPASEAERMRKADELFRRAFAPKTSE